MRWCRAWVVTLIVLASASGLSGCYYDPYTGGYYPYPPYPYPAPPPANPNAPVQQTPLSPPPP